MRSLPILCCLVAMIFPSLSARTVRTIFLNAPAGAPEEATLFTGEKSIVVKLPGRNLSPEVKLPRGSLNITILKQAPADPENLPAGAQKITIPKDWKRCILLFLPNSKNKVFPAKVVAINASQADFPKGSTLIYNISPSVIRGKFGKETIVVKPRQRGTFKAPIQKLGAYPVAIDCILPKEKKPRAICRSNWQHDPRARQILFVVSSPGRKTPRVWGVLDRPAPAEEEEAQ